MRISLWLLALFAAAVAAALFAGKNPGSVTVFWPPYRIDLSLNLVLVLSLAAFLTLHLALRALSALFAIPREARMWRQRQRERSMQLSLLDAYSQLIAGRFVRARKSAELVLLLGIGAFPLATALQDRSARESHYRAALEHASRGVSPEAGEGARLRAARWALDDRDATGALQLLDDMGQGASRRMLALRMRLKASRVAGRTVMALETARLLAKHRALSQVAAHGVLQGLATELIRSAYDPAQLVQAWARLEPAERVMPEVALAAAQRLLELQGEPALSREWLLPVWEQMLEQPGALAPSQRVELVRVLELGFSGDTETLADEWLTRIENAQLSHPGDPVLHYLAGVTCMRLQLWGKARQLLQQSLVRLQDAGLRRDAWRQLAALAQEQGDTQAASDAWRSAAQA